MEEKECEEGYETETMRKRLIMLNRIFVLPSIYCVFLLEIVCFNVYKLKRLAG